MFLSLHPYIAGTLSFDPYAHALPTPSGGEFRFHVPTGCPVIPPSGWDVVRRCRLTSG